MAVKRAPDTWKEGKYPDEVDEAYLNNPADTWMVDHGYACVSPPYDNARFYRCNCGSETFFCFSKPGEYSTWVQCTQCGLGSEIHSG